MSLYDLLGVDNKASESDIKKAYKVMAQRTHPDKQDGDIDQYLAIQEAYSVLSCPGRRIRYDQTGTIDTIPEHEIRLASLFGIIIDDELFESDIIDTAIEYINQSIRAINTDMPKIAAKRDAISRQVDRIKSKGSNNLFEAALKSRLAGFDTKMKWMEAELLIMDDVKLALADYSDSTR